MLNKITAGTDSSGKSVIKRQSSYSVCIEKLAVERLGGEKKSFSTST